MAALEGTNEASPGLKKRRLDRPQQEETKPDLGRQTYPQTTDKKPARADNGVPSVKETVAIRNISNMRGGGPRGGMQQMAYASGSKATSYEMGLLLSGNNLTYSASPSAMGGEQSISDWTSQKIENQSKRE